MMCIWVRTAIIYAAYAKVYFGNHVVVGPNLSIVNGDHRTDIIGRYIKSVGEDDVWIGINVSIFKGVTIGRGSVVAGASTVIKDVPPYSIYISKDKIYPRFIPEQIEEHERILYDK